MATKEIDSLDVFKQYIKLYNSINETNLTFAQAMESDVFLKAFELAFQGISLQHDKIEPLLPTKALSGSTKLKSYNLIDIPKIDGEVLSCIRHNPHISRSEIATITATRLSSVCGAVNRLLHNQFVEVSGETIDQSTNRTVETIAAIKQEK